MATETETDKVTSGWNRLTRTLNRAEDSPLVWLAPALLFLIIFRLYPMIEAVRMSFTNMGFTSDEYQYVGFESYLEVLRAPGFEHMLVITVIFVGASIVFQLCFGLVLALSIDYGVRTALPGSITTRVSVLSAWVIPGIVIGIIWQIMLIESKFGIVNYMLLQLGVDHIIHFLSDPQMALVSTIIANTWRGTAFSMIMLFGGLQQVSQQLHEAARIDGASAIQRFRYITVPQLRPVLFINLVLITIYTVNTFDMILSLTGGGPGRATEVLALYMYFEAFARYDLGNAAALAVMMLVINVVMVVVYLQFLEEDEF